MQLTNPLILSKKEYSILGRLCAKQKPEVARELLSIYDIKPTENDHERIESFFQSFCVIHSLNPDECRGALFKSYKVDQRRLFIACMVRLYLPHVYAAPAGIVRMDYGFMQCLSTTLGQKKPNLINTIREVVVQEKVYPEFKAAVDEITEKLKTS